MSPAAPAAETADGHAPLRLVVGDEELLVERAVARAVAAARSADPAVEVQKVTASELTAGALSELVSPSLFAESRVVVVQAAQDAGAEVTTLLADYARAPTESVTLVVVVAAGGAKGGKRGAKGRAAPAKGTAKGAKGAKGEALLEALRGAGAAESSAATPSDDQRADFVRAEIRAAGGRITGEALGLLMDAVGSDLRELAAAASQLVADADGQVDADAVRRYHRGRADVTSWTVAELAVDGDRAAALENLRWALDAGVAHVLLADGLADAVRTIARVSAAGGGNAWQLASALRMPKWKVEKALRQSRGWDGARLTRAMGLVADLNADVKGGAPDPSYAVERAVVELAALRGRR